MATKRNTQLKKQEANEKTKKNLFIRKSTEDKMNQLAEHSGINPSAQVDLIYSDDAALYALIAKHMENIPAVLKGA